ncbi:MAG: hypothetical protein IKN74_07480 [Clostridia bacterium]|nr:hypothetical protein [Clostridia bacterium]
MGILEEQDKKLNKKREALGKPPIQRDYSVLEIGGQSLNDLMEKYVKQGGDIGKAFDDGLGLEKAVDDALNNKNMDELVAISQGKFEVLDMSVSDVPEEKKREAVDKAKESIDEKETEKETSEKSGGLTMVEMPVEKLKEALKGSDGAERDDE